MKIKSHTDIPQSETLSKIVSLESADMYYPNRTDIQYQGAFPIGFKHGNPLLSQEIPCWSLAALYAMLPEQTDISKRYSDDDEDAIVYWCWNYATDIETEDYDNPVDACYEMIIKLNELKSL